MNWLIFMSCLGLFFRTSCENWAFSFWQLRCAFFRRTHGFQHIHEGGLGQHSWIRPASDNIPHVWSGTKQTVDYAKASQICEDDDDKWHGPLRKKHDRTDANMRVWNQRASIVKTQRQCLSVTLPRVELDFTYTSTGTLNSRGNTAPSSLRSISRDSRRSIMVRAVRNRAGRPEKRQGCPERIEEKNTPC